jgi:hypothetical protein
MRPRDRRPGRSGDPSGPLIRALLQEKAEIDEQKRHAEITRNVGGVIVVAMAAPAPTAAPASAALHEQIVVSGEASGTFNNVSTDVGFWIWCAVDEAGGYDDCNGAMHFDALMASKHVSGEVTELSVGETQQYHMDVASPDGTLECTLNNTPPITHGPTNTVSISCLTPSGSATTSTATISSNG